MIGMINSIFDIEKRTMPPNPQWYDFVDMMINCKRKNNLVYVDYPISKGSFWQARLEYNQWETIHYFDIDWDKDHVFSTIMYPIDRYVKAISCDIHRSDFTKEEIEQFFAMGPKILKNFIFSWHGLPIFLLMGEHTWKIDWIPIDLHFSDATDETLINSLVQSHGITLKVPEPTAHDRNSLESYLQRNPPERVERTKLLLDNNLGIGNCSMYVGLMRDIDLYNQVVTKIRPWNRDWKDISWLTAAG
jgi:hypothetical protein